MKWKKLVQTPSTVPRQRVGLLLVMGLLLLKPFFSLSPTISLAGCRCCSCDGCCLWWLLLFVGAGWLVGWLVVFFGAALLLLSLLVTFFTQPAFFRIVFCVLERDGGKGTVLLLSVGKQFIQHNIGLAWFGSSGCTKNIMFYKPTTYKRLLVWLGSPHYVIKNPTIYKIPEE